MHNPEHHLHDIDIVGRVSSRIFIEYFVKLGFSEKIINNNRSQIGFVDLTYINSDIEIRNAISKYEAYQFAFRKLNWPPGKEIYISTFKFTFKENMEIVRGFTQKYRDEAASCEMYSAEWYYQFMKSDIEFILKFFPEVLIQGDLSRFE